MDATLTIIGFICTLFSLWGAYISYKFFNKNKILTDYNNMKLAIIEIDEINKTMIHLLTLSNKERRPRGQNISKVISKDGESIKNSLKELKNVIPIDKFTDFKNLLTHNDLNIEKYINKLITGSALTGDDLEINDEYNNCQLAFDKIQNYLKSILENLEENLTK